jgi:hypothetical protein
LGFVDPWRTANNTFIFSTLTSFISCTKKGLIILMTHSIFFGSSLFQFVQHCFLSFIFGHPYTVYPVGESTSFSVPLSIMWQYFVQVSSPDTLSFSICPPSIQIREYLDLLSPSVSSAELWPGSFHPSGLVFWFASLCLCQLSCLSI